VDWCERLEYHATERRDDVTIDGAFTQACKRLVEGLLTLPFGPKAALAALPALAGHGVGHADVPGVGAPPPADAATHQGRSSTDKPSISRSLEEAGGLGARP
jgi:hypothetical protein